MWWSDFDTQFSTCIKFSMFFQFSLDFLFAGFIIGRTVPENRKLVMGEDGTREIKTFGGVEG